MSSRGVLAIDFGTANTYFCKCPAEEPQPKGIDFGGGRDGLDTAILYRQGKEPLVGHTAFEEFGEATDDEKQGYRFRAQFKPDIVNSVDARNDATAFLKAVLDSADRQFLDIKPADRRVIFGVPAEADRAFRETLVEIACAAGYGTVETREEPIGGLFYHVHDKTIAPSDALRGVMVVDFGGGTCDMTFTYRGKIQKSWGDMHLGGRVFDDLFFQWLMEQNPEVGNKLKSRDEFYAFYLCRELKEGFSRKMKEDRDATFSRSVAQYGRLNNATWRSFIDRAKIYHPSKVFAQHLRMIGSESPLIGREQSTDLIDWFEKCLLAGLNDGGFDKRDVATVILTGGSSQWPFVSDIVEKVLHADRNRIFRSDRPYAAISSGLAIEPALRHRLSATQQILEKDLPRFQRENIHKLVDDQITITADEIAGSITSALFDEQIKPLLIQFRKNGGTIANLKSNVAAKAEQFEPRVREIVTTATDRIAKGLPLLVLDEIRKWFAENGLTIGSNMLEFSDDRIATPDLDTFNLPNLLAVFNRTIGGVAACIVGIITAKVCGGGGMALLLSGPIGWLIGLVIGGAVAYIATTKGVEAARSTAESFSLPAWCVGMVLFDSKIDSARQTLRTQTREQVLVELNKLRTTLSERLDDVVKKEMQALSELHYL